MPLTEEKVDQLCQSIADAKKAMQTSQSEMDGANTRVAELLKTQEQAAKERESLSGQITVQSDDVKKVRDELRTLAEEMRNTAEQYTKAVDSLRQGVSQASLHPRGQVAGWRSGPNKPNWSCKQEAKEFGYFIAATMPGSTDIKTKARRWLQSHRSDLQFLPSIPMSFVQSVANPILTDEDVARLVGQGFKPGTMEYQVATTGALPGSMFTRPQFVETLLVNVEMYGAFRKNALLWPMGSEIVQIPRRTGGMSVYWENENDTAAESSGPDVDMPSLQAKKLMALREWSSELDEDSIINLADLFMSEFALAIATKEDLAGFLGDGTSTYGGFYGVLGVTGSGTPATADAGAIPHTITGAAGNNLSTEVTQAKLRAMTGALHTWSEAGAKWYMHRTMLADLCGIETTGGGPVVDWSDGNSPQIMGYPVERVEAMTAAASVAAGVNSFALGNLRKSWILGDRRRMEIATSEDYKFANDRTTMRVTARLAVLMVQGNGMVIYVAGAAS